MRLLRPLLYTLLGLFVLINVLVAAQAYHFTEFYDNWPGVATPGKQPPTLTDALFGKKQYKRNWADSLARPFRSFKIITEDGVALDTWYRTGQPRATDSSARGTVLLFHGFSSNKAFLLPVEAVFHRMGYNTLLIDFRAHGRSGGNTSTIGFTERRDVRAAYNHIHSRGEINIVLWGASMGASAVLNAVPAYSLRPHQLILEAPFGSMQEAVEGYLRVVKKPTWLAGPLVFWGSVLRGQWLFGFSPASYARRIDTPTLLQWGTADPRVTRREMDRIHENLTTKLKRLVVYPGVEHNTIIGKQPARWEAAIVSFLGTE
jgi:uncharacterized protein